MPRRDQYGPLADEGADDFVRRMQSSILPHWPDEVLREWLHRHAGTPTYRRLGYRRFRFRRERWPLARVPGGEAFAESRWANFGSNLEERANQELNMLAPFMWEHGTWPSPVILLENEGGLRVPDPFVEIRTPLHLLEGHRRLSFLIQLRKLGRAAPDHEVWVVSLAPPARGRTRRRT